MISLKNKIALITGASSGIGEACAKQFAAHGASLILAARRIDRIEKLAIELKKQFNINVLTLSLDVRDKAQIDHITTQLTNDWKNIDILINNAGLALSTDKIQDGNTENWDIMLDTNVRGLLYVTKAILPIMLERNCGHIVNIGSVAGHECYPGGNVYSATKHAVKAITQSMRIDLLGTAIRVSEVAPGAVHTEFSEVRWNDKKRSDDFYSTFTALTAEDIADAILYCVTRPAHVNVSEIRMQSVDQASANHVFKNSSSSTSLLG
jgi:NADP-dependent 3-hydroxy acid dehydrogenase YdfG